MKVERDIHLSLELDPQALFAAYLELRNAALDMAHAIEEFVEFAGWQWGYGSREQTWYSREIDPMRDSAARFREILEGES